MLAGAGSSWGPGRSARRPQGQREQRPGHSRRAASAPSRGRGRGRGRSGLSRPAQFRGQDGAWRWRWRWKWNWEDASSPGRAEGCCRAAPEPRTAPACSCVNVQERRATCQCNGGVAFGAQRSLRARLPVWARHCQHIIVRLAVGRPCNFASHGRRHVRSIGRYAQHALYLARGPGCRHLADGEPCSSSSPSSPPSRLGIRGLHPPAHGPLCKLRGPRPAPDGDCDRRRRRGRPNLQLVTRAAVRIVSLGRPKPRPEPAVSRLPSLAHSRPAVGTHAHASQTHSDRERSAAQRRRGTTLHCSRSASDQLTTWTVADRIPRLTPAQLVPTPHSNRLYQDGPASH